MTFSFEAEKNKEVIAKTDCPICGHEATWTNAVNEACENIDYRCEDG